MRSGGIGRDSAVYRLIDTAAAYLNEEAVGNAVRKSGVPREEIFVTTKVWIGGGEYEKTKKALEDSLKRHGVGYADLYLIHNAAGRLLRLMARYG